jgi:triosephosphate isomerase
MIPVICVGESQKIREAGEHFDFVASQVEAALSGFRIDTVKRIVLAYEPIWAIGTGNNATAEDAQDMCASIRKKVSELYDSDTANLVRIQYGGSVNEENAGSFCKKYDVDGLLVGGASLDGVKFGNVIKAVI